MGEVPCRRFLDKTLDAVKSVFVSKILKMGPAATGLSQQGHTELHNKKLSYRLETGRQQRISL